MWIVYVIVVGTIDGAINMGLRSSKGYSGGFWSGFFFGILAWIYTACLSNSYADRTNAALRREIEELKDNLYKQKQHVENIDNNHRENPQEQDNVEKSECEITPIFVANDKIKCPVCGFIQPKGRTVCWECGTKFKNE